MGTDRVVLAQPSPSDFDDGALLDALRRMSSTSAREIAAIAPQTTIDSVLRAETNASSSDRASTRR